MRSFDEYLRATKALREAGVGEIGERVKSQIGQVSDIEEMVDKLSVLTLRTSLDVTRMELKILYDFIKDEMESLQLQDAGTKTSP